MFQEVNLNLINVRLMMHHECLKELNNFKQNPKNGRKIEEKLLFNLSQINLEGITAITASPNMEFLKDGSGLCSMRISIGVALRILFSVESDPTGKHVVLALHSFQEERGKRHKNSYAKGIESSKERVKEWKESYDGKREIEFL